jgi:tripartite-type tricarboxylate transporter receptor subunit TctC
MKAFRREKNLPPGRRSFLRVGAGAVALAAAPWVRAQSFPSQPLKLVVPFAPGGFADITARVVVQHLGERLGQPAVIDNRPGAGGVAAAQAALAAPRDGHTMILFVNGTAISKTLFKASFDPEADFAAVSSMAFFDLILVSGKSSPIKDYASLHAEARKRPLNLASINPGSTQNLAAELFKTTARIDAQVVPFRGTPDVLSAVIRGDADIGFDTYTALRGAIEGGQVQVLMGTGPTRAPWLPHVPTAREAGLADYEVTGWNAFYVPAGVPAANVDRLSRAVNEVLALPEVKAKLVGMGGEPRGSTPAEMAALFNRDFRKWAAVIQRAGIKAQ